MKKFAKLGLAALLMGAASTASAATVSSLYGDQDCFGTGGLCIEDGSTWIPGLWGGENADPSDPIWTDQQYFDGETASWTHTFAADSYLSATLTLLTAGIADIFGPYDVFVDGVLVGSLPLDGFGHILAETFSFSVDPSLVSDGSATVSFGTVAGDSWALDYAELSMEIAAVPVPAAGFLLIGALGGLAALRRRRKLA